MVVRVIKTADQYKQALAQLDALMDASPGSSEAEDLELLATVIEIYEDGAFPRTLPDVVDAIKFRMDQLSLIQKDLVPLIGSAGRVSEVLNRKRPLNLRMIRALHGELGIPAEVLLQEPGGVIPVEIDGLHWRSFPVWEMVKRGWLPQVGSAAKAKEQSEDLLRKFLAPLFSEGLASLHCRSSAGYDSVTAVEYSLMAWVGRVVAVGRDSDIPDYTPGTVNDSFMSHLVQLSQYSDGPLIAREFLRQHGIQFVVEQHLRGTRLDGAAILPRSGNPIVALTLRHDRLDHFWFTLCHELGHIALHLDGTNQIIDVEIDATVNDPDSIEGQANAFAQNAIVPRSFWCKSGLPERASRKQVIALAKQLYIDPALVAGRVRNEKNDYRLFGDLIGRNQVRKLFSS